MSAEKKPSIIQRDRSNNETRVSSETLKQHISIKLGLDTNSFNGDDVTFAEFRIDLHNDTVYIEAKRENGNLVNLELYKGRSDKTDEIRTYLFIRSGVNPENTSILNKDEDLAISGTFPLPIKEVYTQDASYKYGEAMCFEVDGGRIFLNHKGNLAIWPR